MGSRQQARLCPWLDTPILTAHWDSKREARRLAPPGFRGVRYAERQGWGGGSPGVHPCRRGFAYERPPIPLVVSSSRCKQCDQPLVEIDHWGERLVGGMKCNLWRKGRARMSATARLRMARWRNRHVVCRILSDAVARRKCHR